MKLSSLNLSRGVYSSLSLSSVSLSLCEINQHSSFFFFLLSRRSFLHFLRPLPPLFFSRGTISVLLFRTSLPLLFSIYLSICVFVYLFLSFVVGRQSSEVVYLGHGRSGEISSHGALVLSRRRWSNRCLRRHVSSTRGVSSKSQSKKKNSNNEKKKKNRTRS